MQQGLNCSRMMGGPVTDRTPEDEKDWWELTVLGAMGDEIETLWVFLRKAEEDWLQPEAARLIHGYLVDAEYAAKNGKDLDAREAINSAREAYIQAFAESQKRSSGQEGN